MSALVAHTCHMVLVHDDRGGADGRDDVFQRVHVTQHHRRRPRRPRLGADGVLVDVHRVQQRADAADGRPQPRLQQWLGLTRDAAEMARSSAGLQAATGRILFCSAAAAAAVKVLMAMPTSHLVLKVALQGMTMSAAAYRHCPVTRCSRISCSRTNCGSARLSRQSQ
jgi:hypothetical protein